MKLKPAEVAPIWEYPKIFPNHYADSWGDDKYGLWQRITIDEKDFKLRWTPPTSQIEDNWFWMLDQIIDIPIEAFHQKIIEQKIKTVNSVGNGIRQKTDSIITDDIFQETISDQQKDVYSIREYDSMHDPKIGKLSN